LTGKEALYMDEITSFEKFVRSCIAAKKRINYKFIEKKQRIGQRTLMM